MKKVIKVLACLLSPLALFSCACKSKEVKFEITKVEEEIVEDKDGKEVEIKSVSGKVKENDTTETELKNVKAKLKVSKVKYNICKTVGDKKDCKDKEFNGNYTQSLIEYISKNNNTEEKLSD